MSDDHNGAAEAGKIEVPAQRSPAYPYISLDVAIDRVKKIYERVRDHAQPREVLAQAYGKPGTSSATIQTFATLLQYGLLENVLTQHGRRMRVTPLAQSILNPHAPQDKIAQALKEAALKPPIFKELWDKYGLAHVIDSVPLYYLTSERQDEHGMAFSDKGAKDVLRVYRATLSFADVQPTDNNRWPASPSVDTPPPDAPEVKVGDLVEVEIDGALLFKEPKRIEEIREHEGKTWVFLEGEKSAVEMDQVSLHTPAEQAQPTRTPPPTRELPLVKNKNDEAESLPDGWSEERLIDDGGDEIKIRYRGKATVQRYEFIRDYLDFKIQRLARKPNVMD